MYSVRQTTITNARCARWRSGRTALHHLRVLARHYHGINVACAPRGAKRAYLLNVAGNCGGGRVGGDMTKR